MILMNADKNILANEAKKEDWNMNMLTMLKSKLRNFPFFFK